MKEVKITNPIVENAGRVLLTSLTKNFSGSLHISQCIKEYLEMCFHQQISRKERETFFRWREDEIMYDASNSTIRFVMQPPCQTNPEHGVVELRFNGHSYGDVYLNQCSSFAALCNSDYTRQVFACLFDILIDQTELVEEIPREEDNGRTDG